MSLMAKDSGNGTFELVPEGTFAAACYAVIDLGYQVNRFNQDGPRQAKVRIEWEVFSGENENEDPLVIGKEYTNSLNSKATLRKDLESWRGKPFTAEELAGFNLSKLIKAPCIINIIHEKSADGTREYASIKSLSPLMKGMKAPECCREPIIFDLDTSDLAMIQKFPKFVQDKIFESEQYQERTAEKAYETAKTTNVFTNVPPEMVEIGDEAGQLPF